MNTKVQQTMLIKLRKHDKTLQQYKAFFHIQISAVCQSPARAFGCRSWRAFSQLQLESQEMFMCAFS
jgi:hypothetical protein